MSNIEMPNQLLVDANGEALFSDSALPAARAFNTSELTALTSAIMRALAALHGPEIVQLITIYAQDIEAALAEVGVPDAEWIPPAATDAMYEAATAASEEES